MRRYITDTEWQLFFDAISGSKMELRDKTMFKMAYRHGLRVSELTGLRVTDLDLSGKTLFIRRLKNGFSTIHPLQDETCHLISAWLDIRRTLVTKDSPWLFVSADGKRFSRQWIYKLSQKYGYKSGVSVKIHPHMLRHACGYALANQGLDTRLIQDYLGHRNISHTVIYTASNPARFIKAWQKT
ncbi:tyrosine-type recombinase/integrase [Salmonella enterica]|uniref:Tyrosine-type recombinase/integrase n=1 Tax=Salmonella enterica TaxID=28901 RepID=A0A5Y5T9F8_SALER|nr:tyrosine-type recombinase/integrase [Salmonella enterica]EAA1210258.1 integrase [Salmonella enterica subsp. enterica serovar Bareilly]EAA8755089.1 integrase [Salmonella enterica subsp. enterica serovar Weltevreden]EAC0964181.1 integrase [Salmonella enterica subsp. enterica serovar Newport]EBR9008011.1 integrase [Salmonella enterica subsp. enterica serovar Richmond]EBU7427008.1 integrase [Salmonella enterica subsp. enterica serovar Lexington]EBX4401878.1 integrase [Salmonella enterica subsp